MNKFLILSSLSASLLFALPVVSFASIRPLKAEESLYHASIAYSHRTTDLGNSLSFKGGGANSSSGEKFALSGAWQTFYNASTSPIKGIRKIKFNGFSSGSKMIACLHPTFLNAPTSTDLLLNKFNPKVSQTITSSNDTLTVSTNDCNFFMFYTKAGQSAYFTFDIWYTC